MVVLPGSEEAVARFFRDEPPPFPVLADADRSRARSWGVYHPLGIDACRTARPASFIVDGAGLARLVFVATHQFQAAPLEDLLRALRGPLTHQGDRP